MDKKCECGQEIVFAINPETGKRNPMVLVQTYRLREAGDAPLLQKGEKLYISHFLTCPLADKFSKGKKKS